jgi:hypothetical protein
MTGATGECRSGTDYNNKRYGPDSRTKTRIHVSLLASDG